MREAVLFHEADGVEVAGNRFPEVAFAFKIGLLNGAKGSAVFVEIHVGAFFAVHQGRDQFAAFVIIVNIAFLDDFEAFGTHVRLDGFEVVFNQADFSCFERRARIAGHTAPAFTAWQTATKLGVQEFVSDDDIVKNNHGAKINFFPKKLAMKEKSRNFAAQSTLKDMENNEVINTLNDIKELMERSTKFKAISGLSIVIVGVLASIAAAYIHFVLGNYSINTPSKLHTTVIVALSLLALAFMTVFVLAYLKAKRQQLRFTFDATTRKLLVSFLVPLVAGGLFCYALLLQEHYGLTSSVMLVFYGLSLIGSSHFSYPALRYLGYAELVLGLVDCYMINYALLTWFLGFGVFHIVFGIIFMLKYERESNL